MQLELHRKEYMLVGLTRPYSMKVLPMSSDTKQQKVAVADSDGVLQLFSLKKSAIQVHFKTLPGPEISCIKLAGAIGTPTDKIFVASKIEIQGYNKKGKMFLSFNTNLTEDITCMYVVGSDLFVCGNHVYNHYRDCKDVGSYLCGDKILDLVAVSPDKSNRLTSILACEGRMLRVLEHSRVIHSIEIDSSPVVLHVLNDATGNNVIYGTNHGQVGILQIRRAKIQNQWILTNKEPLSPISCIDSYDITGDGNSELLLARQDGSVEIYSLSIDEEHIEATLIFQYACEENVTSIQGGVVATQGYNEILVSTYTGRIFGLTTELVDKNAGDSTTQGYTYSQETQNKIAKLKSEVSELEEKLLKERERYQLSTQAISDGLSAIPMLAMKDSMTLRESDASYTLTLEVQTAIDNVLLQSNVPLDLLDIEKNSAVVSHSTCNSEDGNFLLVTYRCQLNTNRLEIKIRTIEGQTGVLQAYVTPLVQPKCCQVRQYPIRPLSLHTRIHAFDETRPFNILKIQGTFSLSEIHTWISKCFPEVPEKPSIENICTLTFKSTFIGTVVHCDYKKDEVTFKTDSVSTLRIIQDFISNEATKRKIHLTVNYDLNEDSIEHTLALIYPKLKEQIEISKQIKLTKAIKELDIQDEETKSQLSKYYQELLDKERELEAKFLQQPQLLNRLYALVTDLFVDYSKFKGLQVHKNQIKKLISQVNELNFEALVDYFKNQNNNEEYE